MPLMESPTAVTVAVVFGSAFHRGPIVTVPASAPSILLLSSSIAVIVVIGVVTIVAVPGIIIAVGVVSVVIIAVVATAIVVSVLLLWPLLVILFALWFRMTDQNTDTLDDMIITNQTFCCLRVFKGDKSEGAERCWDVHIMHRAEL